MQFMSMALVVMAMLIFCAGCNKPGSPKPMETLKKYEQKMEGAIQKSKSSDAVMYVTNKVNSFRREENRLPTTLQELVEKQYLDKLPDLPPGLQYTYNPLSGQVGVQ